MVVVWVRRTISIVQRACRATYCVALWCSIYDAPPQQQQQQQQGLFAMADVVLGAIAVTFVSIFFPSGVPSRVHVKRTTMTTTMTQQQRRHQQPFHFSLFTFRSSYTPTSLAPAFLRTPSISDHSHWTKVNVFLYSFNNVFFSHPHPPRIP